MARGGTGGGEGGVGGGEGGHGGNGGGEQEDMAEGGGRAAGPEKEEGLEADLVEEGWMAATAVDADADA